MNIIETAKNYFIGAYAEMKKVSWPTKNQTVNYSVMVIAMSVGMALFFMLLDYIFNLGIETLISR
jgi:preprotein translocase subunit SecE